MKTLTHTLIVIGLRLRPLLWPAMLLLLAIAMLGCSGVGQVSESLSSAESAPYGMVADGRISVSLDSLFIGPGDSLPRTPWDKYRLTVRNVGTVSVRIDQVLVIDSIGQSITPAVSREQLVGERGATLPSASGDKPIFFGVVARQASVTVPASVRDTGFIESGPTLDDPALARPSVESGIGTRGSSDRRQQTGSLPLDLPSAAAISLDLLFPTMPGPRKLVVVYRCVDALRYVAIDIGVLDIGVLDIGVLDIGVLAIESPRSYPATTP